MFGFTVTQFLRVQKQIELRTKKKLRFTVTQFLRVQKRREDMARIYDSFTVTQFLRVQKPQMDVSIQKFLVFGQLLRKLRSKSFNFSLF